MTHFADCAQSLRTQILVNETVAKDTRRVRLAAGKMAENVVPGQFFMIRNPSGNDPLIGRALALYDSGQTQEGDSYIDLVYLVKGKLTTSLAQLQVGQDVAVWGPLGNGFAPEPVDHLIMVAGGIGQTPFLTLAKEALGNQEFANRNSGYANKVSLCYGARTQEYLAGVPDFTKAGVDVLLATEDGSQGVKGRVTDILDRLLSDQVGQNCRVVCCGPEPMMEAVAGLSESYDVRCQVSLETPMACGIGICFTCVAKVGTQDDWDYKRTCVEGPVFDSREILWE